MWRVLPFLLPYSIVYSVVGGLAAGGWFAFSTAFWVYLAIPIADAVIGRYEGNFTPREEARHEAMVAYRVLTWLWLPIQAALVLWALMVVAVRPLSLVEFCGLAVSVGLTAGAIGITFAHEIIHRYRPLERLIGQAMLCLVSYPHFAIEHVHGHHRRVATPDDPATARPGENFYAYFRRTIPAQLVSAWRLEAARMTRRRKSVFSHRNRMLRYGLAVAVLYGLIAWAFGAKGIIFFALQSFVAVTLLETVNYVEHYGLLRRRDESGRWERIEPHHSWNSSHLLTNCYLINLQRHSDHHYRAGRRFQVLRHMDEAPQLPQGYSTMLLLAWMPPLWFRIMNPRLRAWRETYYA